MVLETICIDDDDDQTKSENSEYGVENRGELGLLVNRRGSRLNASERHLTAQVRGVTSG